MPRAALAARRLTTGRGVQPERIESGGGSPALIGHGLSLHRCRSESGPLYQELPICLPQMADGGIVNLLSGLQRVALQVQRLGAVRL